MNINQNVVSYTIKFNTSTAKYAQNTILSLSYYTPNTNNLITGLDSNFVTLTIINAPMLCSITSSSPIIGDNTSFLISYTPQVSI